MAAKRFLDECDDQDQLKPKRMKTKHSFASVIREVVTVNFIQNICTALEPMLRKVVSEEVENGLRRLPIDSCTNTLRIEMTPPSDHLQQRSLKLAFTQRLSLPIFTGTKIQDIDGNPLRIVVLEADSDHLPTSIKVEILVLDGDFSGGDGPKFAKNIVRERTGKRPLLAGESNVTLYNGVGLVGEIEFTDNSSWIRGRKFRLGARVVKMQGGNIEGVRILEAMTEPFVVKDHRGELYKKHHPPALEDEVWRLEKIGKGGAFHQKLATQGINTVQDFLKLFVVDSSKLRKIMVAMSDKTWEATLRHAKTCALGTKLYKFNGNNLVLTISPICEIIKIETSGQVYKEKDLNTIQMEYMQSLVKDFYAKWDLLEEVDSLSHHTSTQLLTHKGEMLDDSYGLNEQQLAMGCYEGQALLSDGSLEGFDLAHDNQQEEENHSEWAIESMFLSQQYGRSKGPII